jgi:hypothetical protein
MKTVLRKGVVATGGSAKPIRPVTGPAKPVRAPANPYKLADTGGDSHALLWIAVGIVAFVVVVALLMFASSRRPVANGVAAVVQPEPSVKQSSVGVGQPDPALGGLTMAEYMAKHEKDSPALQARRARMKNRPER